MKFRRHMRVRRTLQNLASEIEGQRAWIEEHGATLAGYVQRYGSPARPDFVRFPDGYYGSGGEAIYAADTAALYALEDAYRTARDDAWHLNLLQD